MEWEYLSWYDSVYIHTINWLQNSWTRRSLNGSTRTADEKKNLMDGGGYVKRLSSTRWGRNKGQSYQTIDIHGRGLSHTHLPLYSNSSVFLSSLWGKTLARIRESGFVGPERQRDLSDNSNEMSYSQSDSEIPDSIKWNEISKPLKENRS